MKLFQSRFCGISAIFFQCCLWLKHNYYTIINDSFQFSNFSGVFARNQFLEGGFTFQWGWEFAFLLWRGASFLSEGDMVGIRFDMRRGSKKIIGLGEGCPFMPPLWEILHIIIIIIIIIVTIIIITIQPYRVSGHSLLDLLQKAQKLKN